MAAPRTLNQILTELKPTYDAQVGNLRKQEDLIPQQIQSQTDALNAQKDQAYGDILSGARQRGLGFSGIPLAEQAKYNSTTFLPALANLQQTGNQSRLSLEQAILGVNQNRDTLAQQLYQQDQDRAFQAQQAALDRAAQLKAAQIAAPTWGDPGGGSNTNQTQQIAGLPQSQQRSNKGYNFQDAQGNAINATEYVKLYNQAVGHNALTLRGLLQQMANKGDTGAATALKYVGNDYKFNPNAPSSLAGLFKALGVGGNFKQQNKYNALGQSLAQQYLKAAGY